jgi:hypothetical protein
MYATYQYIPFKTLVCVHNFGFQAFLFDSKVSLLTLILHEFNVIAIYAARCSLYIIKNI